MRGFLRHLWVYLVVNGFLVAIWLMTTGTTDELREIVRSPDQAQEFLFWPVWPILGWGVAVALHGGAAVTSLGRRRPPELPVAPARASLARDATPTRRWLVVMFTDVCDSTALNERLGDEAWHEVLSGYRDVVRTATAARGGTEVATAGDGFLVRFDSPSDAVLCAVDVQRSLERQRSTGQTMLHARIGLHAGEAVDTGDDVLGHVVNLASRVSSAAEADEILVTEPVADQLVGSLQLEDRGLQPLKGVSQHRHLLAVSWSEAATDPA